MPHRERVVIGVYRHKMSARLEAVDKREDVLAGEGSPQTAPARCRGATPRWSPPRSARSPWKLIRFNLREPARPSYGAHQRTDMPTEAWAPMKLFLKPMIPSLTRARLWLPV
jgi:hypothetical protein